MKSSRREKKLTVSSAKKKKGLAALLLAPENLTFTETVPAIWPDHARGSVQDLRIGDRQPEIIFSGAFIAANERQAWRGMLFRCTGRIARSDRQLLKHGHARLQQARPEFLAAGTGRTWRRAQAPLAAAAGVLSGWALPSTLDIGLPRSALGRHRSAVLFQLRSRAAPGARPARRSGEDRRRSLLLHRLHEAREAAAAEEDFFFPAIESA